METQTQHFEVLEKAAATKFRNPRVPAQAIFRREGECWTVGLAGREFRLKDSKGLGYLAYLLRNSGTEFHVLDLVSGIAGGGAADDCARPTGLAEDLKKTGIHIGSLGDAGELLDDQAKSAYRRRLAELHDELEQAKELGKIERAEQLEDEIGALNRELVRAVGLGGRNRRAASASERARQSITKSLKLAVEKIALSDTVLGDIFSRCIKTGLYCSYQNDQNFPIAWQFGPAITKPEQAPGLDEARLAVADAGQSAPPILPVSLFPLAEGTAFVGREVEQKALRTAIDRAFKGCGSVVMLAGGPGVGKTRLATVIAQYASQLGFRCLAGHCYESDEPVPFLPFVEIIESSLAQAPSPKYFRLQMGDYAAELAQINPSLRRFFPDVPEPLELPAQQRRRHLFQSLSESVARVAQVQPRLFILDDLQWADESSLALLIHLASRVSQIPLLIIGTYRDEYSDSNPAFLRTLEELIRLGVRPLKLAGLSKDAVAEMLKALCQRRAPEGLVNAIFEESQGYPFFVEEVCRHLIEEGKVFDAAGQFYPDIKVDEIDVPENVRLIINRRLDRLSNDQKTVLEAAASIGRRFSFQLLSAVSQTGVDELFTVIEKSQQMGILIACSQSPETPFAFAHELVRQTLLASVSLPRRQRLHAVVAQAIARMHPDAVNESAGEIADHLLKAGAFAERDQLVLWLTRAANAALESAAYDEARSNLRSALLHLNAGHLRERADLLASLAIAERGLGQWQAVVTALREALEIYIQLDNRELMGKAFNELADSLFWVGRLEEAGETARRGLRHLTDVSADRARLSATLGNVLRVATGVESEREAPEGALSIAPLLPDPSLQARMHGMRSMVNSRFFPLRDEMADGLMSEQPGGSQASCWQRVVRLGVLHRTLLYPGYVQEAARISDRLEPLARRTGQSHLVALRLSVRALTEFGQAPDLAKLLTALREVSHSEHRARTSFWDALFEIQTGLGDFSCGNWAQGLLQVHAACRPTAGNFVRGFGESALFRHMAYAGDCNSALKIVDEKHWLPVVGESNTARAWWMLALTVESLVMLGRKPQTGVLSPLPRELVDTAATTLWPPLRFTQTITRIARADGTSVESRSEALQGRDAPGRGISLPPRTSIHKHAERFITHECV